eukprot:358909-Chlamydomonas_euryale.AAC.2
MTCSTSPMRAGHGASDSADGARMLTRHRGLRSGGSSESGGTRNTRRTVENGRWVPHARCHTFTCKTYRNLGADAQACSRHSLLEKGILCPRNEDAAH